MVEQKPSVGRVVHYVARGSADGRFPPVCRAATITETLPGEDAVGLAVLNPSGLFFHSLEMGGIDYDEGVAVDHVDGVSVQTPCGWHEPATWHWPGRV